MRMGHLFTEHPQSVGETYTQHLLVAGGFGLRMIAGGIACLVHSLLPFLFLRTGSCVIAELNQEMITRRRNPVGSQEARARIGMRPATTHEVHGTHGVHGSSAR
jgi:hypothetical protein